MPSPSPGLPPETPPSEHRPPLPAARQSAPPLQQASFPPLLPAIASGLQDLWLFWFFRHENPVVHWSAPWRRSWRHRILLALVAFALLVAFAVPLLSAARRGFPSLVALWAATVAAQPFLVFLFAWDRRDTESLAHLELSGLTRQEIALASVFWPVCFGLLLTASVGVYSIAVRFTGLGISVRGDFWSLLLVTLAASITLLAATIQTWLPSFRYPWKSLALSPIVAAADMAKLAPVAWGVLVCTVALFGRPSEFLVYVCLACAWAYLAVWRIWRATHAAGDAYFRALDPDSYYRLHWSARERQTLGFFHLSLTPPLKSLCASIARRAPSDMAIAVAVLVPCALLMITLGELRYAPPLRNGMNSSLQWGYLLVLGCPLATAITIRVRAARFSGGALPIVSGMESYSLLIHAAPTSLPFGLAAWVAHIYWHQFPPNLLLVALFIVPFLIASTALAYWGALLAFPRRGRDKVITSMVILLASLMFAGALAQSARWAAGVMLFVVGAFAIFHEPAMFRLFASETHNVKTGHLNSDLEAWNPREIMESPAGER